MKNLLIICISIFFTTSLSSQLIQWTDDITYNVDCPDPISDNTIPLADEDFEYSIDISSNFNAIPISGKIRRITKVKIKDSNGDIIDIKTQSHLLPNPSQTITLLSCEDLVNLDAGEEFSIELSFCYEMIDNFVQQQHSITTIINGNINPPQQTNTIEGLFACTDVQPNVFCFKTAECEEVNFNIVLGQNGQLTADLPVCGDLDVNFYRWTFLDYETLDVTIVGFTRELTATPNKSRLYCVKIFNINGCFYEDCYEFLDQVDPNCEIEPATGLTHTLGQFGKSTFTWDNVAGATSYVVEINYNDPECCAFGGETSQVLINANKNEAVLQTNGLGISCFSWRVHAICEPLGGSTSEKQCAIGIGTPGKSKESNPIATRGNVNLKLYPNPTSSISKLTIENVIDKEIAINVYSLEGKLVSNNRYTLELGQNTLQAEIGQNLESGIYMIQVNSENLNLTKKIVIQK